MACEIAHPSVSCALRPSFFGRRRCRPGEPRTWRSSRKQAMELRDFAMRRFPVEARGDASRTTALTDLPAAEVFIHDPDGHLLEHLAMLPHPPRPEAGVVPYRE